VKLRPLITLALSTAAMQSQAGPLASITAALPQVEAPPQGRAQWVAPSMRLNGLPMTLQVFESRLDPQALIYHYESWARARQGSETRRSTNAPWQVLTIRTPRHQITIQASESPGGSQGTIAVSPRLETGRWQLETKFPLPSGTAIVNLQQYDDSGIESEHLGLASQRSVLLEVMRFSQLLQREGWQLIADRPATDSARGRVVEAQRGAEHAVLTFLPDRTKPSATAIVIAWKKS
jgi:hypothetical protein